MNPSKQPKIKIPKNKWDYAIEGIGFAAIFFMLLYPTAYYTELPAEIPIHFGADGQPDNYGSKATLWTLPIVGTIIFIGIILLNRFPHVFNYPVKITAENAAEQYKKVSRLLRTVNSLVAIVFAYILYSTVQTALGHQNGLGGYFLWIFILLMSLPLVIYLISLGKK